VIVAALVEGAGVFWTLITSKILTARFGSSIMTVAVEAFVGTALVLAGDLVLNLFRMVAFFL